MIARMRSAMVIAAAMVPRAGLADAQQPTAPNTRATLPAPTAVRSDMADAEPAATAAMSPEAPGPMHDAPRFQWQAFGFLRLQYIVVDNDPNISFVGRDDGFELQNARLGVRGTLDQRISFLVAFDGAVDERIQVNTPDGKLRVGLRDGFADVRLAGQLTARGGLFQAWVDPEALVADTRRELVDQPIESRGMRATEGFQTKGLTPGHSLGAAIRLEPASDGTGSDVGFELAVQNGADELSSNNDNDKPAISATLLARLPGDGWAMVSGRYNPRAVGALPFRQDENDLQATAGMRIAVGPIALGGAVIVQTTSYPTTGGPSQNAFGGHAQAMVTLPVTLPLQIGYRFGILDPSSLITADRVMEHTVGAVLGVPGYRVRVQLQVTHVVEQAARELSNDRAQLAAELSL
jgi:hypothetical protein